MRLSQFLSVPSLRRALFVSIILHLAQQLSGINGVRDYGRRVGERRGRGIELVGIGLFLLNPQIFYYSTKVFQLAGVSNADDATVAVGVVLVAVTLATVS